MARIPQSTLDRLKAEIDLVELVRSSGVELSRRGKDLVGICPFHEDSDPSLVVTPEKNLWHCMGCGAGGSVIDWTMRASGISFRHAVEVLREGQAGGDLRPVVPDHALVTEFRAFHSNCFIFFGFFNP